MKFSTAIVITFAVSSTATPTLPKRAFKYTDGNILNYALTLEHLEDKFYREGLANYSHDAFVQAGFLDPFYENLKEVSSDETAHVNFLTEALKGASVPSVSECTYSFPSTDPKSFVALSSVLEGVGVSAYLGAAADIANPNYLTAAGSILTIEARHSAYIRSGLAESPFPSPFDTPLDPNEVYTLASPFIVSCPPENPQLPLKSFPSLALATEGKITTGSTITLATPGYTLKPRNDRAKLYAAFVSVTGPVFVDVTPVTDGFSVRVPTGVAGQSYIIFTKCNETVSDDTVVAGPAIVEVTG